MASVMIVQAALIYQVQHKTSIARKYTQSRSVLANCALTICHQTQQASAPPLCFSSSKALSLSVSKPRSG